jgi:lipopolysaccharide biosynthesis glycosyltransferase
MDRDDIVHIAFGVDAPYLPHLAATIASIAATAPDRALHFIVMHDGIAETDKSRVEYGAPDADFDWLLIEDAALLALEGQDHISRATYYRLGLPELLPADIGRVLYLDCDLIVKRDIGELWDIDLDGHAIAAVYDAGADPAAFAARWGLAPAPGAYLNAGVLLIDLGAVRREGIFAAALDFLKANRAELKFMDQDALNYVLWRKWLVLDPEWNVQRAMLFEGWSRQVPASMLPQGQPAIVHYTGDQKPWIRGAYHPYAWLYWQALARTPYRRQVSEATGLSMGRRIRIMAQFYKNWPFFAPRHSAGAVIIPPAE